MQDESMIDLSGVGSTLYIAGAGEYRLHKVRFEK